MLHMPTPRPRDGAHPAAVHEESRAEGSGVPSGAKANSQQLPDLATPSQEQQLGLLVSNVTDFAVVTTDVEGAITSWNGGAQRLFGYAADEVIGKPFSIFYPPEEAAAGTPRRAVQTALREGRFEEDGWRLRQDGGRFFARVVTLALRDHGGSLHGLGYVTRDMTEQREADSGIFRLAAMVESSQDAVIGKDLNSVVLTWNRGAERLYGYTRAEAVGQSMLMLLPPEGVDEYHRMIDQIRRGERVSTFETTRVRKDGTRLEVSLSLSPVKDATGMIVGASCVARDITEHKQRERALRGSEARLRAVLDSAVDAIITSDGRGDILSVNAATERMFGYTAAEMLGQNVNMLMPAPYREEHDGYLERYARTGERRIIGIGREVRARRKDGTTFPIDLAVSEVEPGALFTGIIRDISGRKRSEEAVRQSEARLRAVLDSAVDAIITIDDCGLIQSVNRATERMFGYEAAEMVGSNVSMLMPPPYREEHDGYLERYKRTGERRIIGIGREVKARRKDGTLFPIDWAVSEVEPGRLFTGMIRDISDRKLSEARLRETDRMASIGSLAAGLGHDMNNVLLPVRAHLNAARASSIPSDADAHIKAVQKSVGYLQQLADGLHFLAMDPEKADDTSGATDLRAWWQQAGALLQKAVPKHVKVTMSMPRHLPHIAVAPHALTQAILNLVVNAGAAIPPERKRRQGYARLKIDLAGDGATVRLAVTDNGTGMSEEVKRRAFDMFFTTKPRGLGTGLGLALVKKVVEQAGGAVNIESELGKGTTVALTFPVVNEADTEQPLVVLDVKDGRVASLVKNLFEVSGAEVISVSDARDAAVWVTEPTSAAINDLAGWHAHHPRCRMMVLGKFETTFVAIPGSLQPVIIDDPYNLDAIRQAIGAVLTRS